MTGLLSVEEARAGVLGAIESAGQAERQTGRRLDVEGHVGKNLRRHGLIDDEAVDAYRRTSRLEPWGFAGWIGREPHGAYLGDAGLVREIIDPVDPLLKPTGTPENDKMEYLGVSSVFGERAKSIPISSNKSMIGHTLSAAGFSRWYSRTPLRAAW